MCDLGQGDWREILQTEGFDPRIAEQALAEGRRPRVQTAAMAFLANSNGGDQAAESSSCDIVACKARHFAPY